MKHTSNLAERHPTTQEYISTCLDINFTIPQPVYAVRWMRVILLRQVLAVVLFWVDEVSG
jgi:hypothetical protein